MNLFRQHIQRFQQSTLANTVNLLGLAVGLTAFLFIGEYVAFEWGMNRHFNAAGRTYRVYFTDPGQEPGPHIAPGLAVAARAEVVGVEAVTRFVTGLANGVVRHVDAGGQVNRESYLLENEAFVDGAFLDIFHQPLLAGSADLSLPLTLALSRTEAERFFGSPREAVGRQLQLSNQFGELRYQVIGVYEDFDPRSDLKPGALLAIETLRDPKNRGNGDWSDPDGWGAEFVETYIRVRPEVSPEKIRADLQDLLDRRREDNRASVDVLAVADMHLGNGRQGRLPVFGRPKLVWFLAGAALFLLGVAWFNYINLSTVENRQQLRAVGIRKLLGAGRRRLVLNQFLQTSTLVLLSLGTAMVIVTLAQPLYNRLIDLPLSLQALTWRNWLLMAGILLLSTLLALGYTAWVSTRTQPLELVQRWSHSPLRGARLRRMLIGFQFTLSILLVGGTLIVYQQMDHLRRLDLGLDLEQRLILRGPAYTVADRESKEQVFFQKISQLPYVSKYSSSGNVPGIGVQFYDSYLGPDEQSAAANNQSFGMLMIDTNYFDTYGIDLLAGRNFRAADYALKWWTDGPAILNETAVRQLGFASPAEAVDQTVYTQQGPHTIIGVTRDYYHFDPRAPLIPMVFWAQQTGVYYTLVLDAAKLPQRLRELERIYTTTFAGEPFDYTFAEASFEQAYADNRRVSHIFMATTTVSLLIAALGIVGLVSFMLARRRREIGIRKVLGATAGQVVRLISREFLGIVLVAFLIATPLCWYLTRLWLRDFAERIVPGPVHFLLAGVSVALLVALLVGLLSGRASLERPVKVLREE